MGRLILLRHGESEWNRRNLFTGWVDIPLSEKGIQEALEAGKALRKFPIDRVFTSELMRAQMTANLSMAGHPSGKVLCLEHPSTTKMGTWAKVYSASSQSDLIPMRASWHLNERMYGKLQGLNKEEVKQEFGEEQFKKWRRSFREAPPEGESLFMTKERTLPFFNQEIFPWIKKGETILISAHGNSLRALLMEIEKLGEEEVVHLELATGKPLVYAWNGAWKKEL